VGGKALGAGSRDGRAGESLSVEDLPQEGRAGRLVGDLRCDSPAEVAEVDRLTGRSPDEDAGERTDPDGEPLLDAAEDV
jgi:hypothetical protein